MGSCTNARYETVNLLSTESLTARTLTPLLNPPRKYHYDTVSHTVTPCRVTITRKWVIISADTHLEGGVCRGLIVVPLNSSQFFKVACILPPCIFMAPLHYHRVFCAELVPSHIYVTFSDTEHGRGGPNDPARNTKRLWS